MRNFFKRKPRPAKEETITIPQKHFDLLLLDHEILPHAKADLQKALEYADKLKTSSGQFWNAMRWHEADIEVIERGGNTYGYLISFHPQLKNLDGHAWGFKDEKLSHKLSPDPEQWKLLNRLLSSFELSPKDWKWNVEKKILFKETYHTPDNELMAELDLVEKHIQSLLTTALTTQKFQKVIEGEPKKEPAPET